MHSYFLSSWMPHVSVFFNVKKKCAYKPTLLDSPILQNMVACGYLEMTETGQMYQVEWEEIITFCCSLKELCWRVLGQRRNMLLTFLKLEGFDVWVIIEFVTFF